LRSLERCRPIKCVGSWQLMGVAGRGSFTEVYFAKPLGCQADWPADYALKMLQPSQETNPVATRLMRREAEVGQHVSQAHLVPILEAHVREAPCFLVMPRLSGAALGQVLAAMGRLAVRQALWITRQIAEALEALHARGWLHGDVKPSNIVVSTEGHATLIDLGFALRREESYFSLDRPAIGTLHYVAPEVLTSALATDQRSDIYSLGVALFEMLTGRLPFDYTSPGRLVEAHRNQPVPDPRRLLPCLSDGIVKLLGRMMAKEPLRRPQSARELIELLVPLEVEAVRQR
jgi:serine/threonine-protein kinase